MRASYMTAIAISFAACAIGGEVSAAPIKAAVFDFEMVDTSTEGQLQGVREDQTKRLEHITQQVKDTLEAAKVDVVDIAPARDQLKDVKAVHDCVSCAQKAATTVGADYAVLGHVQKVSNLILNINLQIVDARTGKTIRGGSADIRGNTDESWDRGTKYLMKNNILKEPLPAAAAQ